MFDNVCVQSHNDQKLCDVYIFPYMPFTAYTLCWTLYQPAKRHEKAMLIAPQISTTSTKVEFIYTWTTKKTWANTVIINFICILPNIFKWSLISSGISCSMRLLTDTYLACIWNIKKYKHIVTFLNLIEEYAFHSSFYINTVSKMLAQKSGEKHSIAGMIDLWILHVTYGFIVYVSCWQNPN
jgi:hypothetical protein